MRRAIQFLVCIAMAGCVTAKVHRQDQEVRPALTPDGIQVLNEAPDRPYRVIARIESKSNVVFKGFEDLRNRIIAEAAQLGGEAVILGPESTESEFIILATGMVQSDRKKLAGDVIVFR